MAQTGQKSSVSSLRKLGLTFVAAVSLVTVAPASAKGSIERVATVSWSALPMEAKATHRLIRSGGPFPYAKDGSVFGNRERLLPGQSRGFYREYTVKTPGANHRGARRIVCGGRQPTAPEACFYTDDHYASFARIVQ